MSVSIIVAMDKHNVIGNENTLLWHIPLDLQFFKETTTGRCIIMGRKTFASIGKPLPNRKNIVLTRDTTWNYPGVYVYHTLEEALANTREEGEVFIIGGGEIYRAALPQATKLYVTHVDAAFSGDVTFPEIDPRIWKKVTEKPVPIGPSNQYPLTFATYERLA